MFAAVYTDTPLHGVECVITPFPCSAISPQRSLIPQYVSSIADGDDGSSTDDVDDILSQWSMSPGPPSPRSDTSVQRSLSTPHDSDIDSSVDRGCDGGYDTSSQSSMSPDPPSPKFVATATQRSSHLVPVTSSLLMLLLLQSMMLM